MAKTVEDLVNWVVKHRKDKVFRGYTKEQIREHLLDGLKKNQVFVIHDKNGEIDGMVSFRKSIHVDSILTLSKDSFKNLISALLVSFGNQVSVTATRRGKLREYKNVPNLVKNIIRV